MSPAQFKYFPFLPWEIRKEIWAYAINDRVNEHETLGRVHYFSIYDTRVNDEFNGELVPAAEKLDFVVDKQLTLSFDYALAAPRSLDRTRGTWGLADAYWNDLEWSACRESVDLALQYLTGGVLNEQQTSRTHPERDPWKEKEQDYPENEWLQQSKIIETEVYPWQPRTDDIHLHCAWDNFLPQAWSYHLLGRYTSGNETRWLPINQEKDLLVIQPLYINSMNDQELLQMMPTIFRTHNVAFEFDPAWGYPDDKRVRVLLRLCTMQGDWVSWVLKYCHGQSGSNRCHQEAKVWFVDYRLRLRDGLELNIDLIDIEDVRQVFRDGDYYYVECWDISGGFQDGWCYVEPIDVENGSLSTLGPYGVLARIPVEEVELVPYDDWADIWNRKTVKGRVKRRGIVGNPPPWETHDAEEVQDDENNGYDEGHDAFDDGEVEENQEGEAEHGDHEEGDGDGEVATGANIRTLEDAVTWVIWSYAPEWWWHSREFMTCG